MALRDEASLFVRTARLMHRAGMPMFHPSRIAGGLKGIMEDPKDTRHVFTLFESMIGPIEVRQVGHFIESDEGRALFAKRPPVVEALTDRERLRQMPDGSLGRAYLAFVEAEGISADGLVEASQAGAHHGARHVPRAGVPARVHARHARSLAHAHRLQGDIVGELSLLAFGFAQMGNLGVAFLILTGLAGSALAGGRPGASGLVDPRVFQNRAIILGGFVRGLRARWLPVTDWVSLLEQPLEDVRKQLAVGAAARVRARARVGPRGHCYPCSSPSSARKRTYSAASGSSQERCHVSRRPLCSRIQASCSGWSAMVGPSRPPP
jgi:ubiquinone biosynthesis protein COQ4